MVNYKKCCYYLCKTHSKYEKDIRFFNFPKPKSKKELCLKWIEACGNPKLTLATINQRHYVCSRHFLGSDSNPIKGYLNAKPDYNDENTPIDLSISKNEPPQPPSSVTIQKSVRPQLYFAKNFTSADFNADFFATNEKTLLDKTCTDMKDVDLEGENVKEFLESLNPNKLYLSPDIIVILTTLSSKNIKDKGSFIIHARQLRENSHLISKLITLFLNFETFKKLSSEIQEKVVFNWLRRFMNNILTQWVSLKPDFVDTNLKVPEHPAMSLKEIKDKEDQIIHHIGGYTMRKIANRYEEPAILVLFENCIAKDSGSNQKTFTEWTTLISRGGLLSLTTKGFRLFKMLDQFTKPFYQNVNKINLSQDASETKSQKAMVLARLKETDVINFWYDVWGNENVEHREKAMSLVFDTYINCRGSALRNYTKIKLDETQRLALAKKKGLRRLLKESLSCTCKVKCYCKAENK